MRCHRFCGQCIRLLAISFSFIQVNAATSRHRANPIRKVVNLLMGMQKKVTAEGETAQEMYEKFMCNFKTMSADLEKSISSAKERIPQLEAAVKEADAALAQLTEDLKTAEEDRKMAKEATAEAIAIREKDAATFEKESTNQRADIDSIEKAVKAIEKGQSQSMFLQTKASTVLRRLSESNNIDLSNVDRDLLSNFLSLGQGGQEPSSGEILGILKQMHEEMSKDLAEMVGNEDSAVANHQSLLSTKAKEIEATTKAIEVKMGRKGNLAVEVTKFRDDLEDSRDSLEEDSKFLGESKRAAEAKEKEHDEYKKVHADELVAIADTIKLLNDDDALDLFKKTLPSPAAASFVQLVVSPKQMKRDALHALRGRHRHKRRGDPRLDLLALALRGKKGGNFDEVLKKVDKLIANLATEQADDTKKKSWCIAQLKKMEDEIKWTARSVSDVTKVIGSSKEDFKAILSEIEEQTNGIKELDKSVAAATKQRKAEHEIAQSAIAESNAAQELLQMAYNRLAKFYNPKLAGGEAPKPAAQQAFNQDGSSVAFVNDADLADATDDGDSSEAPAFVQVNEHSSLDDEGSSEADSTSDDEAESDDEEDSGASSKKPTEESGGVMHMITILKNDVAKSIVALEAEEKDAQKDYEVMMQDSADKRAIDTKAIANAEAVKAKIETELQKAKVKRDGHADSLQESKKELQELHNDCDWFLQNFDSRKTAREDETDALTKARAVLSGADYS